MDVHDVGDYQRRCSRGWRSPSSRASTSGRRRSTTCQDTPENRAFKEKVRAAVQKYKDIGVRIEDSFLLTETGLKRLSATVPRTIEEIERYLKTPRSLGANRVTVNASVNGAARSLLPDPIGEIHEAVPVVRRQVVAAAAHVIAAAAADRRRVERRHRVGGNRAIAPQGEHRRGAASDRNSPRGSAHRSSSALAT